MHDPRISNLPETKASIKMKFNTINGREVPSLRLISPHRAGFCDADVLGDEPKKQVGVQEDGADTEGQGRKGRGGEHKQKLHGDGPPDSTANGGLPCHP